MIDAALAAFGLDDLMAAPSQNGHVMGACFGCGAPVPLRKNAARLWCHAEACRKAAGKQRQKDLRERRSKIQS